MNECVFVLKSCSDLEEGQTRLTPPEFSLQRMLLMFYGKGLRLVLESLSWQQSDGLEIQLVVEGGVAMEDSKWSFTGSRQPPRWPLLSSAILTGWQRVAQAKWQTRQCDPKHPGGRSITVLNTPTFSEATEWKERVWAWANLGPRPLHPSIIKQWPWCITATVIQLHPAEREGQTKAERINWQRQRPHRLV